MTGAESLGFGPPNFQIKEKPNSGVSVFCFCKKQQLILLLGENMVKPHQINK